MFNKEKEMNRLWEIMKVRDKEIVAEGRNCQEGVTERYRNLKNDMVKLKDEYEKLRGYVMDPNSIEQREAMTRKKVMGDMLGRTGPDSHTSL